MSIQAIQHAPNLVVWHDQDAQPEPLAYHWFLHGVHYFERRDEGESAADLWTRTLLSINERRCVMVRDRTTVLDSQALVTVYAGDLEPESLQVLERKHMREHICLGLQRIAGSRFNNQSDSVAAVKALQLLGELTGVIAPRKRGSRVVKQSGSSSPS